MGFSGLFWVEKKSQCAPDKSTAIIPFCTICRPCPQTLLWSRSHLICPTYSLLHKLLLANKHFSVQVSARTVPGRERKRQTERARCVRKRHKRVNAQNSCAEGLRHMVASARDVRVALGTCWRPHTGMEHGTLHGLCLSHHLPSVCVCVYLSASPCLIIICLSSLSAPVCRSSPERAGRRRAKLKG